MNDIHFMNFASDGTGETKNLLEKQTTQNNQVSKYGISRQFNYTNADIAGTGLEAHLDIIRTTRGCGLWFWKPYFILLSLTKIPEGDFLLYLDTDVSVNMSPKNFIYKAKEQGGIAVMKTGFVNECFTKPETFAIMGVDNAEYRGLPQLWAGVMAFENRPKVRGFILDWLLWCANHQAISDSKDFPFHRHDQSILTILIHREGFTPLENEWNVGFAHPPE